MKGFRNSLIYLLFLNVIFAQEQHHEQLEQEFGNELRIGFGIGHAHLREELDAGNDDVVRPSFYLDMDYWFSNKFAAGVHSDLIYEDFIVEGGNGELIEREKPIAIIAVGIYKPFKSFSFQTGYGQEFSAEENFSVWRLGVEYGVEMPKHWEFGASLIYDVKFDAYDTWVLGFGVAKILKLGKNKKKRK